MTENELLGYLNTHCVEVPNTSDMAGMPITNLEYDAYLENLSYAYGEANDLFGRETDERLCFDDRTQRWSIAPSWE